MIALFCFLLFLLFSPLVIKWVSICQCVRGREEEKQEKWLKWITINHTKCLISDDFDEMKSISWFCNSAQKLSKSGHWNFMLKFCLNLNARKTAWKQKIQGCEFSFNCASKTFKNEIKLSSFHTFIKSMKVLDDQTFKPQSPKFTDGTQRVSKQIFMRPSNLNQVATDFHVTRVLFLINNFSFFIVHVGNTSIPAIKTENMQKEWSEEKKRNTWATSFMSFLKSFCGRVFVNKNSNLHKKCLFFSPATTRFDNNSNKYAQRRRRRSEIARAVRKYLYKLKSVLNTTACME